MTVRELISKLQEMEQDAEVGLIYDGQYPDDVADVLRDAAAGPGEWSIIITNIP